jgi:hypothetical protein
MATPGSPSLSDSQLTTLAALGEERKDGVGDALFRVGDATYPFIAIREGEVAILDAAGNEIVRHGPSSFLGAPPPWGRARWPCSSCTTTWRLPWFASAERRAQTCKVGR